MWGYNLCFFRPLAVEREWDENISSLVSVKDITRRRSPPQQVTFRLNSLWQEKREDYDDVNPRDFLGVTLGNRCELIDLFDVSISVFSLNPDGFEENMETLPEHQTGSFQSDN